MSDNFLAQTLNSNELLALLYICESNRKGTRGDLEELLQTFFPRLANLGESSRFEVLEAHLMSVEDIDIYHDETLKNLMDDNRDLFESLKKTLNEDRRFHL